MGQIKILKINQNNINAVNQVINVEENNYIKEDKYNFLIKALETYNKKEYDEGEIVLDIIKVMLPCDHDEAKSMWNKGVELESEMYVPFFATTGGMKQEHQSSKSKCEVIFIREEKKVFMSWFSKIISMDKFHKLDNQLIYVNKDVLSRFSLTTSTLITEIELPNIIILPQATINLVKTYTTVKPSKEWVEVESKANSTVLKEKVTYSMEDYEFKGKIEVFDGGGIATPTVMDAIGQSFNKTRNDIDFAIIRNYGLGIKGLVTKFDIIKYLDIFYKEDTAYCRKVNGKYELLDMFDDWKEVTDNTLLLNESMVKLAKLFKKEVYDASEGENKKLIFTNKEYGMKEYNRMLETFTEAEQNLLNKLYITKVNKPEYKLTDYRRLNYQCMNALALTLNEYESLSSQDYKLYKKLLKPFEKVEECDKTTENERFKANIDYINLFFKSCINEVKEIIESEDLDIIEKEELEQDIEEITNVVDRANTILNINKDTVKLSYVKKQIAYLIEKRVREMANGKFHVKATYNYMAVCPISYMNYAMTREQGDNGLKEGQFYNRKCDNEEVRTIFRNPLMAYSEIHNIGFIRNVFLDNWLCKSSELIYFNQKSNIQAEIGSSDFDGDSVTVIDSPIIRNAVIETEKPFFFLADGEKVPQLFNAEGIFECTYKPSGNMIGSISILATSPNSKSQTLPTFFSLKNHKFYNKDDIKDILIENNVDNINDNKTRNEIRDIVDKNIEEMIENEILAYTNSLSEEYNEIVRDKIKQQFKEHEKEIYSLLYCSSLTIDSPKTMNVINPKLYTEAVDSIYRQDNGVIYKPYFLQYKKNRYNAHKANRRGTEKFSSHAYSIMDKFAEKVQKNLLDVLEKHQKSFGNKAIILQKYLEKSFKDANIQYNLDHEKIAFDRLSNHYAEYSEYKDLAQELTKTDYKKYREMLRENDIRAEEQATELKKEIDNDLVAIGYAISRLEHCSEDFLINTYLDVFIKIDQLCPSLKSTYELNLDGEIEFMYQHYKKTEKLMNYSDSIADSLSINKKIEFGQVKELRFMVADSVSEEEKEQVIIDITNKIKESLIDINKFYELDITEEGLSKIGIKSADLKYTKELNKILENGNKTITIAGFMRKKKTDEFAISKKSFGIYINC
ncbi:hypothetical protein [Clostridium beijerinckii]|uniref:hypothetical protein n=1 Tax=Clostridium beijerinckii TaxID=1520 RepID=UPI00098CB636|nr:hypothetical protein [Clostridium beijerinckii]NRT78140.1 hypothetical protein [Clostridium beijerinckii]OOM44780.1 hypothetical protein CBEIJ_35260 [Clostridium beijerinckii]